MTFITTSVLSGVAAVIKMISGLLITKVIAIYVGPIGIAAIGNLQNFINIMLIASGDFLKTASVKYTAQYENDECKRNSTWSTQLKIILILNLCVFLVLFLFSEKISLYLFKTNGYSTIIKIMGVSLPFFVLNTFLLSILNGVRNISKYIALNIVTNVVSLIIVICLTMLFRIKGALIAYAINQSVVFVITLFSVRREKWFKLSNFIKKTDSIAVKNLFGFALITLTAVLATNISIMHIRNYIMSNISPSAAGYWQGIWTLSQASMTIITTALSTYFLPTISALKDQSAISQEIKMVFKIIVPLILLIALAMYFGRDIIISVLYTKAFIPMKDLFLFQVIGNSIQILAWVYGYVLVAKSMVKYTVITEIVFAFLFVLLSYIFMSHFGLIGVTYAFSLNSLLHLITMATIYKFRVKLYV